MRLGGDGFVLLDGYRPIASSSDKYSCPWTHLRVCSVPHTGTNFLDKLLKSGGWKVICSHEFAEGCFSPIRSPDAVYRTWMSRGRDLSVFYDAWKRFNDAYKRGFTTILPLDTPDREIRLKSLSEMLYCDLSTDWEPVENGEQLEVDIPDLSPIYSLDVVRDFYENETI